MAFGPTAMYHATKPPVVVRSMTELKALGKGWADSPAAFKQVEKAEDPDAANDPPAPTTPPSPIAAALWADKVEVIVEASATMTNVDHLELLVNHEKNNPAGARKDVLAALRGRIRKLAAK